MMEFKYCIVFQTLVCYVVISSLSLLLVVIVIGTVLLILFGAFIEVVYRYHRVLHYLFFLGVLHKYKK